MPRDALDTLHAEHAAALARAAGLARALEVLGVAPSPSAPTIP